MIDGSADLWPFELVVRQVSPNTQKDLRKKVIVMPMRSAASSMNPEKYPQQSVMVFQPKALGSIQKDGKDQ